MAGGKGSNRRSVRVTNEFERAKYVTEVRLAKLKIFKAKRLKEKGQSQLVKEESLESPVSTYQETGS